MAFWMGILVGGFFAWLAIRIGLLETWAMLFNILVSIYLAVFLGPTIANIPGAADAPFSNLLAAIGTAIATFLVLHTISYTFITAQFSFSFPKILGSLGAGLLGFLAGLLVWSFASILICLTPISEQPIAKGLGFCSKSQQTNVSYMSWWCDLVNKAVASQDSRHTSKEAINALLEKAEKERRNKTVEPPEPNEPTEPNVKTSTGRKYSLGRPEPPLKIYKQELGQGTERSKLVVTDFFSKHTFGFAYAVLGRKTGSTKTLRKTPG
jgi:hypothetical protein